MILGMAGTTIAFSRFEEILHPNIRISSYLLSFTSILFLLLTFIQLYRLLYYFEEVKADFSHPTRINFFAAFSISLLLLSVAYLPVNDLISKILWIAGVLVHTPLTFLILNFFIRQDRFTIQHYNPAWFIPIVGNMVIPIAGVEHFDKEISWFYFSIGFIFSIFFMTIFLYRVFFHHPLPEKLVPTFFILLAPPSVGVISYYKLTGQLDSFTKLLYGFSLFLVGLFLFQFNMFYRIRFYISWWAYLFPSAAFTIATLLVYQKTHNQIILIVVYLALLVLIHFFIVFIWKTVRLIGRQELCVKEE